MSDSIMSKENSNSMQHVSNSVTTKSLYDTPRRNFKVDDIIVTSPYVQVAMLVHTGYEKQCFRIRD